MLKKNLWMAAVALASGVVAASLVATGIFFGLQWNQNNDTAQDWPFPEALLHASGSDNQGSFAMATGSIDENTEGIFILDFLTGDLQCAVMNHREGKFYGAFKTNIAGDLPVDRTKDPQYVMVTGFTQFVRGGGNTRPAQCVVYVLDANTGQFVAYGLPWNTGSASAGRPQVGALTKLDGGMARQAAIAP